MSKFESNGNQDLVVEALDAIATTRTKGKVSQNVQRRILEAWLKYPIHHVCKCLRIYLDKDYAGQGKDEAYLAGILRREAKRQARQSTQKPKTPEQSEDSWLKHAYNR